MNGNYVNVWPMLNYIQRPKNKIKNKNIPKGSRERTDRKFDISCTQILDEYD